MGTQTALYEFRGGKISATFEEFCWKRARGTSQSRPGGVSCLLPVAGRMRCCCRARDGRYLVGGLGDVEATGTSVLPEKIWQWVKKGYSFYANFTRDTWVSRKFTVVNSYSSTGKSYFARSHNHIHSYYSCFLKKCFHTRKLNYLNVVPFTFLFAICWEPGNCWEPCGIWGPTIER